MDESKITTPAAAPLERVPEWIPPTRPTCEVCGALAREVYCPTSGITFPGLDGKPVQTTDGGALETCYLCAHLLVHHEAAIKEHGWLGATQRRVCRCKRSEIYPPDELERRAQRQAAKIETFGNPDSPEWPPRAVTTLRR